MHEPLTRWLGEHRGEMLADLRDYVELETPSGDVQRLQVALGWLESLLTQRIGPPASQTPSTDPTYGDTLVLEYPASSDHAAGDQAAGDHEPDDQELPVTALCHYDTVWSAGTLADWPVRIDDDTLTGPGAFDMKGGLIQLIWAIRAGAELGLGRPPLRLILNPDEEIGSPSSRPVIESQVLGSSAVLVFESAAAGAIKTGRKGVGLFDLTVTGVEAHAGLDPGAGASAIDELARLVLALHAATDLTVGTTLNVGVIEGGTRPNVKAGRAGAKLDVRIARAEEAARIDAFLADLTTVDPAAELVITGGWNRPPMQRSAATGALFDRARRVAGELGQPLTEVSVGGGSDGNFAAALGLPVLDGLGAVGQGAHARHEQISISAMLDRTALVAALLADLHRDPPADPQPDRQRAQPGALQGGPR